MSFKSIEGMIPPVVVPFDERENLNRKSFRS